LRWSIEDDQGRVTTFLIHDVLYVPNLPFRLLSPQHLAQNLRKQGKGELYSGTDADQITINWGEFVCTVPLDPHTNVSIIRSAPGYKNGNKALTAISLVVQSDPCCFPMHVVSDDEEDSEDEQSVSSHLPFKVSTASEGVPSADTSNDDGPSPSITTEPISFDLKDLEDPHLIETNHVQAEQDPISEQGEQDDIELGDPTHSMLQWHYRLGHLPFKKLQQMAKKGQLPLKLPN